MEPTEKFLRVRKGSEMRVLEAIPPRPVRFLFLVAVYRELDNGNLHRFFASAEAAGARPDSVSVLFVVNNSEAAARAGDEACGENQRTLAYLRGNPCAAMRTEVLDLASRGCEKNMGKIRQAGIAAWGERASAEELAETVVVHLDADVTLPANFFPIMKHAYGAFPDLEAAFFRRDYDLRGEPDASLLFSHHRYRLRKALFDFTNQRNGLAEGLATYQLSARYAAHARAGGFPPVAKDEDSLFTQALLGSAWWAEISAIETVTEDRTRAEGFNSARRARDLRHLRSGVGPLDSLRGWWQRRHLGPLARVEALRPPPPKDFFLLYGLFVPLAASLNEEVRQGALSFAAAEEELGRRTEAFLGVPVPRAPNTFARKAAAEIPDMAAVPGTGGSVLPPVAHTFSAVFLLPTLTPGTDLEGSLGAHLTLEERQAFRTYLAAELTAMAHAAHDRRQWLRAYFRGEAGEPTDPFLAWVHASPALFASSREAVARDRVSAEGLLEKLSNLFPDYLSDGASFARETAKVRALNRVLAAARAGPVGAGGIEAAVSLLKRS